MKHYLFRVTASAAVLSALMACGSSSAEQQPETVASTQVSEPAPVPAGLARVDFHVKGMTCGGCEFGTRTALSKVDGVQDAGASYTDSKAWAVYDPAKASTEQMMAAIRQLGYEPAVIDAGGAPPAS